MTTTSASSDDSGGSASSNKFFSVQSIQCGEFPDHAGRPDDVVRQSVGRERDHDRDCRFAGAAHDRAPAPDGLFYS